MNFAAEPIADTPTTGNPRRLTIGRVVLMVAAVVLVAHLAIQCVGALARLFTGRPPTVETYGLVYTTVLGGLLLVYRGRIAHALRSTGLQAGFLFLATGLVMCTIEELTCYLTNSGMWEPSNGNPLFPHIIVGVGLLWGWVIGCYVAARYYRLGALEILVVGGLAGWFIEAGSRGLVVLLIQIPVVLVRGLTEGSGFAELGDLLASLLSALIWIPWATWAYAVLILVPLALVPGWDTALSTGGRGWRYPVAFVTCVATTAALLMPLAGLMLGES